MQTAYQPKGPVVWIQNNGCWPYAGSFSKPLRKRHFNMYLCQCAIPGIISFINPFACRVLHAIFFPTACQTACKHAFRFLRVFPEAVSTCRSWLWQTLDDVYTRRCFAESEGTRFGPPGQKALPSVNEFTLLWIFA